MLEVVRDGGELFQRYFGIKAGESTEVVDAVHRATARSHRSRRIVLFITLDVRNAFNSMRSTDMLGVQDPAFYIDQRVDYKAKTLHSMFDSKMGFLEQINAAVHKAAAGVMPNESTSDE